MYSEGGCHSMMCALGHQLTKRASANNEKSKHPINAKPHLMRIICVHTLCFLTNKWLLTNTPSALLPWALAWKSENLLTKQLKRCPPAAMLRPLPSVRGKPCADGCERVTEKLLRYCSQTNPQPRMQTRALLRLRTVSGGDVFLGCVLCLFWMVWFLTINMSAE